MAIQTSIIARRARKKVRHDAKKVVEGTVGITRDNSQRGGERYKGKEQTQHKNWRRYPSLSKLTNKGDSYCFSAQNERARGTVRAVQAKKWQLKRQL